MHTNPLIERLAPSPEPQVCLDGLLSEEEQATIVLWRNQMFGDGRQALMGHGRIMSDGESAQSLIETVVSERWSERPDEKTLTGLLTSSELYVHVHERLFNETLMVGRAMTGLASGGRLNKWAGSERVAPPGQGGINWYADRPDCPSPKPTGPQAASALEVLEHAQLRDGALFGVLSKLEQAVRKGMYRFTLGAGAVHLVRLSDDTAAALDLPEQYRRLRQLYRMDPDDKARVIVSNEATLGAGIERMLKAAALYDHSPDIWLGQAFVKLCTLGTKTEDISRRLREVKDLVIAHRQPAPDKPKPTPPLPEKQRPDSDVAAVYARLTDRLASWQTERPDKTPAFRAASRLLVGGNDQEFDGLGPENGAFAIKVLWRCADMLRQMDFDTALTTMITELLAEQSDLETYKQSTAQTRGRPLSLTTLHQIMEGLRTGGDALRELLDTENTEFSDSHGLGNLYVLNNLIARSLDITEREPEHGQVDVEN